MKVESFADKYKSRKFWGGLVITWGFAGTNLTHAPAEIFLGACAVTVAYLIAQGYVDGQKAKAKNG
jgi:hypothetical protein